MTDTSAGSEDVLVIGYPDLELPLFYPPTPEEIERRRKVIAETRALREKIGPIGIASDDLLHLSREESEE